MPTCASTSAMALNVHLAGRVVGKFAERLASSDPGVCKLRAFCNNLNFRAAGQSINGPTSMWACASAMEPNVRLAGRAVGGVANCDRLKSLDPGVRMLRGDSGLGDASACKSCTAS